MDSRSVLSYLKDLCTDIDQGRTPRRFDWKRAIAPLAVPAAMAFSLSIGGCLEPDDPPVALYSAPMAEICDDGIDNDGDGASDCDDRDCDQRLEPMLRPSPPRPRSSAPARAQFLPRGGGGRTRRLHRRGVADAHAERVLAAVGVGAVD